jgi:hypothetical protein
MMSLALFKSAHHTTDLDLSVGSSFVLIVITFSDEIPQVKTF